MSKDRLEQLINFTENLSVNQNSKDLLKGAIENAKRLQNEGEKVKTTLNLLKQVEKLLQLIPANEKKKNN